ncbi:protein-tyrosine phosphatase-like protein [Cladochytrium replicatum]|nr:protein-tyrosine phosphatase-like protein [Cladochytrium replicatum]
MAITRVVKRVFLSDIETASDRETLATNAVTHVVRLLSHDAPSFDHIKYHTIRIDDIDSADLLSHIPAAVSFIKDALATESNNVLVHCHAGVSRSPAIIIAYLMHSKPVDLDLTLAYLKSRKPTVQPNPGFIRQLSLYHSMGCSIDESHPDFRLYVLQRKAEAKLRGEVSETQDEPQSVPIKPQRSTTGKRPVRCKRCRHVLATEENILGHSSAPAPTQGGLSPCRSVYVEPLPWMGQLSEHEGRLDCPSCSAKLGNYSWAGIRCSCGEWVTPAFMFHLKSVDA